MLTIAICDDNNIICSKIEKIILEYEKLNYIKYNIKLYKKVYKMLDIL